MFMSVCKSGHNTRLIQNIILALGAGLPWASRATLPNSLHRNEQIVTAGTAAGQALGFQRAECYTSAPFVFELDWRRDGGLLVSSGWRGDLGMTSGPGESFTSYPVKVVRD